MTSGIPNVGTEVNQWLDYTPITHHSGPKPYSQRRQDMEATEMAGPVLDLDLMNRLYHFDSPAAQQLKDMETSKNWEHNADPLFRVDLHQGAMYDIRAFGELCNVFYCLHLHIYIYWIYYVIYYLSLWTTTVFLFSFLCFRINFGDDLMIFV